MERSASPAAAEPATALLICLFHLNLAFSSLEEEDQGAVVERCYRPLITLAQRGPYPIAIEATGWTLERIAKHDPNWLTEARSLIEAGRMELVGSGYAQLAGPLVPATVNRWNLCLGLETYMRLLGTRPRLALLCEQAYSPGLVDVYAQAGFEGIIADWDNAWRSHPEWDRALRHHPQRARGVEAEIPVLWSGSIAFQKFQRYAHAEMTRDEYVQFVAGALDPGGMLMLYANDAEVFDRRPGRFAAEPEMLEGEWERIGAGLDALIDGGIGAPGLPSDVLTVLDTPGGGRLLSLEAPDQPVPVKKQDKYNVSRWAVTGRDDIDLNTRCGRLYEHLRERSGDPEAWRDLCALWASDLRTHITQARWSDAQTRLAAAEKRWEAPQSPAPWRSPSPVLGRRVSRPAAQPLPEGVGHQGRLLRVRAGDLDVTLNTRRGLAIASFVDHSVAVHPLFGTIEHGYFETIELGADWYTGNLVQEAPLRHKVTDLEPLVPSFDVDGEAIMISGVIASDLGPIEKAVRIDPEGGTVEVEWALRWSELPPGSLRFGHLTLHPRAFDAASLFYATHNGGDHLERHRLARVPVDHGAPVSALVSARMGLGVTEGLLLVGDERMQIRIEIDQAIARPLGLITYRPARERFFLRASLSLTESDETRRGAIPRMPDRPQRAQVRYTARGGR